MSQDIMQSTQAASDDEPLLRVRDLKTYYDDGGGPFSGSPVKAVDGVSFDIYRGETLGLVGESGCGKTTLGRTLVQLETATAGEIQFDGRDVTRLSGRELKTWRRDAQMVFQDPESSLNDRMTVGEIVREPLDVHDWPHLTATVEGSSSVTVKGDATAADPDGRVDLVVSADGSVRIRDRLPLDESDVSVSLDGQTLTVDLQAPKKRLRRDRVQFLLDRVGLQREHYFRYPHQFSGGQRQRIGIARALALEPKFIVLDEPVSALDVSVQAQVLNLLDDLQEEFGLTYLFIAHDLSVVRHISDRVAVMYLGHVMELGPTEEIFEQHANPYTISLLSAIPDPDPTTTRERITLRGAPPSPRDPPQGCPFSTRCPMAIRPDAYQDLDDTAWQRIQEFREVARERDRADRSLIEIAKEFLGMEGQYSAVEEVLEDLFEDVSLPDSARERIDQAAELITDNNPAEARDILREEFGSVCDRQPPTHHTVAESGRTSYCHRHDSEYTEPTDHPAYPGDRTADGT